MLMSSQYAVASYVCPNMSPMDISGMSADCMHEMEAATSSLCKAHCDQSPQSHEVSPVTIAPFMVQTHWTLDYPDVVELVSSRSFNINPVLHSDGSPPLRIQFQVFRI